MKNTSTEKLKKLILYLLNRTGEMSKVKLAKLLLFAEVLHYEKTGHSFTGLYFVRLKYGPVIAFFDEILEAYKDKLWKEEIREIPIYEEGTLKRQFIYSAITQEYPPAEMEDVIKKVVNKFGKKSGTELSSLSHSLPAWRYSEPNEPIYAAELSIKEDKEYFALIDLLEDTDDDDAVLAEKLSRSLAKV